VSARIQVPAPTVPVVDKDGRITVPWNRFFTALAAKLNDPALNFEYASPDLIWKDPAGVAHEIASE